MKIHSCSAFRDPTAGKQFIQDWNARVIAHSGLAIQSQRIASPLGETQIWVTGNAASTLPPVVIFPGFRTCALFWILDGMVAALATQRRIYLIDTNGQPSLSEGNTPDIKGDGYGHWAAAVLTQLQIPKAIVMGASFGGLVCLKLDMVAPEKVVASVLMNPGCLAPFSLAWSNLYHNLLPIISPKEKNVRRFLDRCVFHKPGHAISKAAEDLLVEYELYVLRNWKDKAQKPYAMKPQELSRAKGKVHLILGDQDPLFPHTKSRARAQASLDGLQPVRLLPGVAHGIELSKAAMAVVQEVLG